MDLINIASGYIPLSLNDVDRNVFTKVMNFDPLDSSPITSHYVVLMRQLLPYDRGTYISRDRGIVDKLCRNGKTNLLMAVSPFGFTPVDAWLDRKLAPGGWVLLAGSKRNKYIKQGNAFSEEIVDRYMECPNENYYPRWLNEMATRILAEYPSQASNLHHSTRIDTFYVYQKKMRLF